MRASEDLSVKILKQLEGLGANSQDIALNLKLEGIQGEPRSMTSCPLALYLNKHFSEYEWTVGYAVAIGWAIDKEINIKLEAAILEFIMDFDSLEIINTITSEIFIA